jgi:peptide/nickel transport system permease protein
MKAIVAQDAVAKKKKSQLASIFKRLRKNKLAVFGLITLFILVVLAVFAPYIAPYPYDQQNLEDKLAKPGSKYLLGADNFGRDILSRLIYGSRISLIVGFISVGISLSIGGTLGAISAFYGGKLDIIIMRFCDVLQSVPQTILAIAVSAALGSGVFYTMLAIGIASVPRFARVCRAAVLTNKEQEYVEACYSIGASNKRIIMMHIIPNSLAPIIVQATSRIASAIIAAASLSFVGLGVQPPTPEWGSMLSAGRAYVVSYPHMVISPGLSIVLTVFSLNMLGDGLRDALDPRLKN